MVRLMINSTSGISKTVEIRGGGTPYFAACADARLKSMSAHASLDIWKADQVRQVLVADVTATNDGNSDRFKSIAHRLCLGSVEG